MSFYSNVNYYKNYIYETYIDNQGTRRLRKNKFKPELFSPSNEKTEYKDIYDTYQKLIPFSDIYEYNSFIKEYRDIPNFTFNGDIDPVTQYIQKNYQKEIEWDMDKLKIWYIDIENDDRYGFPDPELADKEILSITVYDQTKNYYIIFGCGVLTKELDIGTYHYIKGNNEADLLKKFVDCFQQFYPDILIGWNSKKFDIPYIINRIKNVLGVNYKNKLSPFGIIDRYEHREGIDYTIIGVNNLDYLELYKKYQAEKQEHYSLDHIAKVELGNKKIKYRQKYKNIYNLYKENYNLFIEYNVKDVELLKDLNKKLHYIDLHYTIKYIAKVRSDDAYKITKIWDGLLYKYTRHNNIILPAKKYMGDERFRGAHVFDPIKGMHEWVMMFDINSLYPNLIMSFNISPETLLKIDHELVKNSEDIQKSNKYDMFNKTKDYCITANGCVFNNKVQGIFPQIMDDLYKQRKIEKKHYKDCLNADKDSYRYKQKAKYHHRQYAFKILLNGGYGALGTTSFRFYDLNLAEAVTISGRTVIQLLSYNINNQLKKNFGNSNYFIGGDTDSNFIKVEQLLKKRFGDTLPDEKQIINFLFSAEKYIDDIIKKTFVEFTEFFNSYKNTFKMELEKICNKMLIAGKKHYISSLIYKDGKILDKPKFKYVGIEVVRKDTPELIREKLKETIKYIFSGIDNDTLKIYIKDFYKEFEKYNYTEIAKPSSVNGIKKYSTKEGNYKRGPNGTGCPSHVRASILYNKYLKKYDLVKKYKLIKNKDKIKWIYLKMPNKIGENIIAFPIEYEIPKEFGLIDYIDYKTQFEKVYKIPVLNVVKHMGWNLEEYKGSLSDILL